MSVEPSNNQTNDSNEIGASVWRKIKSFLHEHWTFLKVSAVTTTILALLGTGVGIGVWKTKLEQPAEIASLQSDTKRLQELNIKIESDKDALEVEKLALEEKSSVLESELKKKEEELEIAKETDSSGDETGNELKEEVQAISEPSTTDIEEQDTSVFFEQLNVSIVNINRDTEPYTTLLTASGNKSKPEKYESLMVGDKVNYSLDGKVFEITVTNMSSYDVGVSVIRYQENE